MSFTITCTKLGGGIPVQTSTDTGFQNWTNTLRSIDVNKAAQYGDSFGRIYVAVSAQTVANPQPPAVRGYGIYGLTPDMKQNSFFGGLNPTPVCPVIQTNTLTFTVAPTNGQTFTMDGVIGTWTTNTVTNTATQIAVTNAPDASATNLAAYLNANLATAHTGTVAVTVSGTVVSLSSFAQNIAAEPYYSFATPGASGPFGPDFLLSNGGFGSGPYRMFVGPQDGLVWVTDATDGNANIFVFGRNFESTNQVWTVSGRLAGEAVGEHGNVNAVAVKGSLAQGNLQIFTADNDLPVPSYLNNTNLGVLGNAGLGNFGSAQETVTGDANVVYGYNIGAGPFPCTNTPVFAATIGLDGGFPDGQVIGMTLGTDTNLVYASMRRFNYSDGGVQAFRQDTGARVYTSLSGSPTTPNDVFAVAGITPIPTSGNPAGVYTSPRVSPDGRYIAIMSGSDTPINRIVVANLVNGIPDESSVFIITNLPTTGTPREIAWDAADNLYSASSGQGAIRSFSLGISTTCITSNDITGTNGSFQLLLPPASVSVANNGNASQNYGSPTPGNFAINLSTSTLTNPVIVNFSLTGTATNRVNYNISTNSSNGVTITTNVGNIGTITFPAGTFPGTGNWTANITVTPTPSPLIGPTLTVGLTIGGGTTYIASSPLNATVSIANTGPQFFFVSAAATGTTMNRSITNDYAQFVINRWGDLNGPSNSVGSVSAKSITLTNFALAGTALFGTDYTAGVQLFNGTAPIDGTNSITFAPGVSKLTAIVGNPVSHAAVLLAPTNVTILPGLTNAVTGTNGTSADGYSYFVNTATTTLTEFDNAIGRVAEVVLWSDPLTNSATTNYTVTFASTNLANTTVLPVLIQNYAYTNGSDPNGTAAGFGAGNPSNTFDVQLGWPISSENAFETSLGTFAGAYQNPPPSAVMVANGWSNVLRMSVDKQIGANPTMCGVNLFPTTNTFVGNNALRFDMYLSVWSGALANPVPLNFPRQFAAFGINTQGTNCDWRLSLAGGIATNTGSGPTNADGLWYCVDAADQSLTPADFDGFASPALPNAGTADAVSGTAFTEAGVFKRPPFPATDGGGAGTPINQWVSVSVETHAQTNVSLIIDSSVVLGTMAVTNVANPTPVFTGRPSGNWTNGTPMLGYLQPYPAQSDESAFVYFSNVRMVELSPYIITQPLSALVLAGSNLTLTSFANYASPGLTNVWFTGSVTAPTTPVQTNSTTGTNLLDTLTLTNIAANGGNQYFAVFSDLAGSVTSYVARVEVISTPTNVNISPGGKATFTVTSSGSAGVANGQSALAYQWMTNGINLANGLKYTNVTTVSLGVSNVQAADTLVSYSCVVTNISTNLNGNASDLYLLGTAQSVTTAPITLTILNPPASATVAPAAQTNIWGSSAVFTVTTSGGDPPFTYTWKKGATNLVGAAKYSGTNTTTLTISNLTQADTGSYTVGVTNVAGITSSAGVLTVFVPPPTIGTAPGLGGGHLSFNFTSTNGFDKTNTFTLQSSTVATGPYTNATGSTITGSAGNFNVTVPQPTNTLYYRLKHAN